ncbi:TlyA family RNA methyltransferase [Robbsia andropogonis]|uniref:TlyA family RNA methyltransferase n=1 Tax=Robbsia andropogonis TaxID=28092 RepID=UPI0020A2196F|nr:TlyA family RNA methyltransferase [Robbsia andropogonis]MCP1120325.1 TlyA family RNA methyltransferase [Robbsia andropogonis]MCP1130195.1 TlyA family RNA methyltransferase [Robbsia andropogonis]
MTACLFDLYFLLSYTNLMENKRLDEKLFDEGYFDSLQTARGWIMAGRVVVDGKTITQTGYRVKVNAAISLRGMRLKYASKGGYKLERALQKFELDVSGLQCLDAGASTGGFTDCLLQAGAAFVYAVDVGYGQLRGSLALDQRVRSMERTNIGSVTSASFQPAIDFACADLSYLSMSSALPQIRSLFSTDAYRIVFLIKPLYEGLNEHDKSNTEAIRPVLCKLFESLSEEGFVIENSCASPILGGRGAMEFLAYACSQPTRDAAPSRKMAASVLTDAAIADAMALPVLPVEQFVRNA